MITLKNSFYSLQVPTNVTCHPNNVVVAMRLPYIKSHAPKGLETFMEKNYDDSYKVCVLHPLI